MRIPRALLTLAAVVTTQRAWAQAPLADVPFTLHQNAIIVQMVANDRDTLHLLLDTGWGPMALTDSALARLNRGTQRLAPSNGYVNFSSLAIGALRKTDVPVEILGAADLVPLIGPHDGVLATAYFRDLVLQVDYPKRRVRFYRRSPLEAADSSPRRTTVTMTFAAGAPGLPFTDSILVNGRLARGLFDTGGMGAFVAMPRLVASQQLDRMLDSTVARMGYLDGSARQATVRFARLQRIQLGAFVVDTPRAMLAPPQLAGGNWGHDLVIGYGFLRRYIVTFDYPGRRITLELPAT
ncbi:MAG: hypothetical protein ACRENU_01110 [Gemmatimonadaceae bacterium]